MRLNNFIKLIVSIEVVLWTAFAFAEDAPAKAKDPVAETTAIFEQALKNFEAKKQQEQDALIKNLHTSLNKAIYSWIDSARADKKNKVGSRIQQNWEKLASSFKIPPTHFEYYLRGYKYTIIRDDVTKSETLKAAYKAIAVIKEELYVEKYHSPDVSDANPYFFTVTTTYNLNYDYKDDKFVLVNTESKVTAFENNAPEEIKKPKTLI